MDDNVALVSGENANEVEEEGRVEDESDLHPPVEPVAAIEEVLLELNVAIPSEKDGNVGFFSLASPGVWTLAAALPLIFKAAAFKTEAGSVVASAFASATGASFF